LTCALKNLQTRLDILNDIVTAQNVLAEMELADHPVAAALLERDRIKTILMAAADAYDDLIATKQFCR